MRLQHAVTAPTSRLDRFDQRAHLCRRHGQRDRLRRAAAAFGDWLRPTSLNYDFAANKASRTAANPRARQLHERLEQLRVECVGDSEMSPKTSR